MGDLVESTAGLAPARRSTSADGKEVWIAEFYGHGVWAAVRIPDDHFFAAANRARIGEINLNDPANYMASPNIYQFAIDKGWYDPKSGKPFLVYENYAPYNGVYSTRREWRALSLVAPSLKLVATDKRFPFSVKAEKKLSVQDVWNIKADYYQGTDYDMSKGAAAGPWGNPLRYPNSDSRRRQLGAHNQYAQDLLPHDRPDKVMVARSNQGRSMVRLWRTRHHIPHTAMGSNEQPTKVPMPSAAAMKSSGAIPAGGRTLMFRRSQPSSTRQPPRTSRTSGSLAWICFIQWYRSSRPRLQSSTRPIRRQR